MYRYSDSECGKVDWAIKNSMESLQKLILKSISMDTENSGGTNFGGHLSCPLRGK